MAIKEFNVKLGLDTKGFSSALKGVHSQVASAAKKISAQLSDIGKSLSLKVTAPLLALAGIAVKVFDTQIQAENKLIAALEANGQQVESTMADYKDFASELQRVSTVGDEVTLGLLQISQSMGVTGENAKLATKEAISLAKAIGISERSTIRMTAALADGDAEMLTRYIPSLRGIKDKSEKVAAAHAILAKMFSAVTAEAKSGLGPLIQMKNRLGDMLEKFGEIISLGLQPFIEKVNKSVDWIDKLDRSEKALIVTVGALAGAIGPLLVAIGLFIPLLITGAATTWALVASVSAAIVAVITFIAELVVSSLIIFVTHLHFMIVGFAKLALAVAPVVILIASVLVAVRGAIQFFGFLAGVVSDNAKVIVDEFGPAIKLMLQGLERLIRTTVFLKNSFKGIEEASRLATKATMGIQKSISDLTKEIEDSSNTKFSDDLRNKFAKLEQDMNDATEQFDASLKRIPSSISGSLSSSLDFIKTKTKDLGSDIAKKISEGLKDGLEIAKGFISGFLPDEKKGKPVKNNSFADNLAGGAGFSEDEDAGILEVEALAPPPESKSLWDQWADHVGYVMDTVKQTAMGLYDSLSSGFGQAVGDMLIDGADFAQSMKSLFSDMVKSIISALVKMAMQAIASSVIASAATNAQADTQIVAHASTAAAGAASSQSSIPFIGPILALVAAGAMFASVMAFRGKLKLAKGGITQGPTNALIGEAGQEAVIPLDRLDSIMGAREQTIIMNVDGRELARSVIRNSPREIRIGTGVTM